jgi:NADH:ubiquinone oxidoreductase subunit K
LIVLYYIIVAVSLFATGLSGVLASRHFLVMMLSLEVALASAALLALSFYYYISISSIVLLLLSIWTVAATEVIALVVIYKYMIREEVSLDVTKLSKLKN